MKKIECTVKCTSGRESRWAECSCQTCKTHFRVSAAHCDKPGSISLHAEEGKGSDVFTLKFSRREKTDAHQ